MSIKKENYKIKDLFFELFKPTEKIASEIEFYKDKFWQMELNCIYVSKLA